MIGRTEFPGVASDGSVRPEKAVARREGQPIKEPTSYWLLLVFVLLLYANLPFVFPASEAIHPAKILAGAGILALMNETFLQHRKFGISWPDGGYLLAFFGAAALSCLTALWPGYAFDAISTLVKMVIVYFFIVTCTSTERALQRLMWTMVVGGILPALGTINNYLHGRLEEGRASWVGIFANPNEVAYSLVILLPIAAYLAISHGWIARIALLCISAAYLVAIFVTFSRGGLIGLGAAAAVYAWRKRSAWLLILLICAGVGSAILGVEHWSRGQDFSDLNQDVSFQERIATSEAGIRMFLDHPLLGVGIACSIVAWPLYAPNGLYTRGALITHNTVVQSLSETGILGFVPFMLFIGVGLCRSRKLARSVDKRVANAGAALEAAMWGFVVCGMSGGYVLTWFPYLLMGLVGAARRIGDAGPELALRMATPRRDPWLQRGEAR
ncbi:MAG TPA: O-antigen ligase family protein [Bryobacteraceae bacterium]|jgi:O-antigen ligase